MFRRSKTPEAAVQTAPVKPGGKGRPTPSRRDAEAARKARVKAPADKKAAQRLLRERRAEQNAKIRQGMKTGEERYLPARDKGPVRRYVRDYIDSRLCVGEVMLPVLLIALFAASLAPQVINTVYGALLLLVVLDTSLVVFRLRREIAKRFPGEVTKGAVLYGVVRSIQLRWFRLPKPQVKLGQKLPERY